MDARKRADGSIRVPGYGCFATGSAQQ